MNGVVWDHDAGSLSALDRQVIAHIPPGGNWRNIPVDFPSDRVKQIREGAASGTGTRSSYYGRLTWDAPASTIATYFVRPGNGANIHPAAPRTLTFREAARLQGFADNVRFYGPRRARATQIGNAVPPPVAARLAARLPVRGTAVELFAGAGGLGAGLHAAGFQVVTAVDNDEHALRTLAGHLRVDMPLPPQDLSKERVRAEVLRGIRRHLGDERLALLAGGPPCQGFSTAGNNRLFEDSRNELPDAFVWMVQELRPRQVLFENVAALTWESRRPWFERLLLRLRGLGYNVAWRLVHCEAYGIPQKRRRVVVVGTAEDLPTYVFPAGPCKIQEPAYWATSQSETPSPLGPATVRDAIADLPLEASPDEESPVELVDDGNESEFRRYVRGTITLSEYVRAQDEAQ